MGRKNKKKKKSSRARSHQHKASPRKTGPHKTGSHRNRSVNKSALKVANALELQKQGRPVEAEKIYDEVLKKEPDNAEALHFKGIAAYQTGRHELAIEVIKKSISIAPGIPETYSNLSLSQYSLGRFDDAVISARKAIELNPSFFQAHNNLGTILMEMENPEGAIATYTRALELKPDFPDAWYNISRAYCSMNMINDAIISIRKAIDIEPDREDFYHTLVACFKMGLPDKGGNRLRIELEKCLEIEQVSTFDLRRIVSVFLRLALKAGETAEQIGENSPDAWAYDMLSGRLPNILKDNLLMVFMEKEILIEQEMEELLGCMRKSFLVYASDETRIKPDIAELCTSFLVSLALQTFLNEYVYLETVDETKAVEILEDEINNLLSQDENLSLSLIFRIIVYATYRPLFSAKFKDALSEKIVKRGRAAFSDGLAKLIERQIMEPEQEKEIAGTMNVLTRVDDIVSKKVKEQYEENPYPRWQEMAFANPGTTLDFYSNQVPHLKSHVKAKGITISDSPKILIAGCGTGMHPINTAKHCSDSHVLAVDLSLSSLAYAKRKAESFGVSNIEFGQADILKIDEIGRTFDIIECSGVLHHLKEPEQGLKKLLEILNTNGLMLIGLYSEIGRKSIVAARQFIKENNVELSPNGIRELRKTLWGFEDGHRAKNAALFGDFFTLSSCRDLLFHVQESRFELPQIKEILEANSLEFLGFSSLKPNLRHRYKSQFPDDPLETNLDNWHEFEIHNPYSFSEMYKFIVQKIDPQKFIKKQATKKQTTKPQKIGNVQINSRTEKAGMTPGSARESNELYSRASKMIQAGKYADAVKILEPLAANNPDNADTWHLLGIAQSYSGMPQNAVESINKAIAISPQNASYLCNLGVIYYKQQRLEESLQSYDKALAVEPENAEALYNKGIVLFDFGRFESAVEFYKKSLTVKPGYAEALNNLGNALKQLDRRDEAVDAYKQAIAANSNHVSSYIGLGNVLRDMDRLGESIEYYNKAVQLKPDSPDAYNNLGAFYHEKGDSENALLQYEKALIYRPDFAETYNNMGAIFQEDGRIDEALDAYNKAINLKSDYAESYKNLASCMKFEADAPEFETLEKMKEQYLSETDQLALHFALGKMYSDIGSHQKSFHNYYLGNEIRKKIKGSDFTIEAYQSLTDFRINNFNAQYFEEKKGFGVSSKLPVFILGMPRSGTTLVEQILSSHSDVFGAGELYFIGNISGKLFDRDKLKHEITKEDSEGFAREYLAAVEEISKGSPVVIDKMPHNFESLWLIYHLFPFAKVFHCRRDPMDTCLSCYFNDFKQGHGYKNDLGNLGMYYREYERLMAHWSNVLPMEIFEVKYEDLLDDVEGMSRKMLDFVELEWDEACLKFYENKRPVKTGSNLQVRNKIYKTSVKKWKQYESFLFNLKQALDV